MKLPRWKKIACPRCQASAGSNCAMEPGNWILIHPERRAAAERLPKAPSEPASMRSTLQA